MKDPIGCVASPVELASKVGFSAGTAVKSNGNYVTYDVFGKTRQGHHQVYDHHDNDIRRSSPQYYPLESPSSPNCKENQFKCKFDQKCISKTKRCDAHFDCWDGSDERGCLQSGIRQTSSEKDINSQMKLATGSSSYNTPHVDASPRVDSVEDLIRDPSHYLSKRKGLSSDQLHSLNCQCSCSPLF